MTVENILTKYPWGHEVYYNASDKPLDIFWQIDAEVAREKIWPFLIDTSTTNKMQKLPQMSYHEKDGALYGKARYFGIWAAWREEPWQWNYLQEAVMQRVFTKGFAKFVRAYIFLEEIDPYRCRISFYFGWLPKGKLNYYLLKAAMSGIEKKYHKIIAQICEIIHVEADQQKQKITLFHKINTFRLTKEQNEKITEFKKKLLDEDLDLPLVEKLINFLRTASEEELSKFRVKQLSYLWQVDKNSLLKIFLHGTRLGLFTLSWDIICPHCRGMRQSLAHLGEIPAKSNCEVCEIDFDTEDQQSIEVIFHLHPSIVEILPKHFCAAEPSHKPHIFVQQTVMIREKMTLPIFLPDGLYNLRKLNSLPEITLNVHSQNRNENPDENQNQNQGEDPSPKEIPTAEFVADFSNNSHHQEVKLGNQFLLSYFNDTEKITQITLETKQLDDSALRPAEVFSLQSFRDLFSEEALASKVKLNIGNVAVMFTDVIGSTILYKQKGDDYAFMMVKRHFHEIYTIVNANHGVVVKTIGDAVMASFEERSHAMKAALELQKKFERGDDDLTLKIRVSLNYGKVLAVNLNSNVDYFGQTVNLAAKLQGVVSGGEISFNANFLEDASVKKILKQHDVTTLTKCELKANYTDSNFKIYKIKVTEEYTAPVEPPSAQSTDTEALKN